MRSRKIFLSASLIFLATLFFYIPVFINPPILLNRNNDLQEQFWPTFYFIKTHVAQNHVLPLWNNLSLSGTPLLPDPQFSLFYPFNLIFLLLPINLAFLIIFFLHSLTGGVGTYLASKHGFKLSNHTSLFLALSYIFLPKMAGYLEAGHYGLILSLAWQPFVILSVIMLLRKSSALWSILLAISLAGCFFTHTAIFLLSLIVSILFFVIGLFKVKGKLIRRLLYFSFGILLTFGLISITLLPQLEWAPQTTRSLLLQERDTYPKWTSITEPFVNMLFPWIKGIDYIQSIDTEKWIPTGFFLTLLSLFGFLKLENKIKLIIASSLGIVLAICLNNSSPFYKLLLSQDWYAVMRVSTRVISLVNLTVLFLAGFGFEMLLKQKSRLLPIITAAVIGESLVLSWLRISQPPALLNTPPQEIYHFFKNDQSRFRIFCITRCLSPTLSARANLELIEGYNPLIQKNFNQQAWQLTGSYWKGYTHTIPPIGTYTFEKLHPDPSSLGDFNVKYIVSPYKITDSNLIFEKQFGQYLVYKNQLFRTRAYYLTQDKKAGEEAHITIYTPNFIRINTTLHSNPSLVLAEVYSKGWSAYLNGNEKVPVLEKPDTLRVVNIKQNTDYVDFKYEPTTFKTGKLITLIVIILILAIFIAKTKVKKHFSNL